MNHASLFSGIGGFDLAAEWMGWTNVFNCEWEEFPTQSPICGGDDGLPKELDGITFSKWRRESIKAYGNAIVPQVALQIFEAIQTYEHGKTIQGGVDPRRDLVGLTAYVG